ncbi:hypothetical protein [Halostella sp. PRR32]|uniref:hypothetical protein n=1 Tax=Halostella sp. PRR32 TaxID=3098147 RepID=UPI002B1E80A3|nr:hypothetical protein [Halostella sp. PRR32]
MEEPALRRRLDAALALLVANFLLLLALAFRYVPETAVRLLAVTGLVGYGLLRES